MVKQSLLNDFVDGLKAKVVHLSDGLYLALALRLRDGRLPVVALDAEFCLNLKTEMGCLLASGMFDIQAQLGEDAAIRRAELKVRSTSIPPDVFLQDMEQAVAEERSANLIETGGFIELDVILRSGWEATVWFDAAAGRLLAELIHDACKGGLQV